MTNHQSITNYYFFFLVRVWFARSGWKAHHICTQIHYFYLLTWQLLLHNAYGVVYPVISHIVLFIMSCPITRPQKSTNHLQKHIRRRHYTHNTANVAVPRIHLRIFGGIRSLFRTHFCLLQSSVFSSSQSQTSSSFHTLITAAISTQLNCLIQYPSG